MPIEESGLMAAVDAGVASVSTPAAPAAEPPPAASQEESTNAPNTDAPAATSIEGGEPSDGSGGQDAGGDAVGAENDAAGGAEPAADGAEDSAAAAAAAAAEKPAEPAAELTAEQKLEKALNDPIPNALKRETKERINTLSGKVRETMSKLTDVTRDRDDVLQAVISTGASPQQYTGMLNYLTLINGDNAARERALEMMQQEVAALAISLGKVVPGVNFLEGHADLINEVGSGRLSPERAMEIAAGRARSAYETRLSAERGNQQRVDGESMRAVNAGKAALTALENELKADPHYVAKKAILVQTLKPVFATIPPSQWAATFKRAYAALPAPANPVPPPSPPPTPGAKPNGGGSNTPLRASNPSGGTSAPPASPLEALNVGIASARGR